MPTFRPMSMAELAACDRALRAAAQRILRNADDADEAAQEAWLALFGAAPHVHDLDAWLLQVVRYQASRCRRRGSCRSRHERAVARLPWCATDPADDVRTEEFERLVRALPQPYRTVVSLRYLDDLAPAEIAERTGQPHNTVKCQLRRAHRQLRLWRDARAGDRDGGAAG
jgi:RNA polymerase sigma-70 factor (ECF subfamily)